MRRGRKICAARRTIVVDIYNLIGDPATIVK